MLFIDPQGTVLLWRFLSLLGILLGGIVFAMMRFPRFRRQRSSFDLGFGWLSSALVACLITGGICWFAFRGVHHYFYRVDQNDSGLSLGYIYPERTVLIDFGNIEEVRLTYEGKLSYRMVVRTESGESFHSLAAPKYQLEHSVKKLRATLRSSSY